MTEFMLKTCRQRPPLRDNFLYALQCCALMATKHCKNDVKAEMIPFSTGSAAEFYIEPMLSCVGDVDIMVYFNNSLAIPEEHPPPTQLPDEFHNRVLVCEVIDTQFPGYVYLDLRYLLAECNDGADGGRYLVARRYDRGSFARNCPVPAGMEYDAHGPAQFTPGTDNVLSMDAVYCVRCLVWPPQAADWPTRHRNYGWPDSATVDHVVSNGCDLVGVAHRQCRQHEWMKTHQHRLSFSRAEIVLINSWMPVQQIVYHMLRKFVKAEQLTADASSLSNYHIKTLMLWASERQSTSWWTDNLCLIRTCVELLHTLAVWLTENRVPHYFIDNCNLFTNSFDTGIIVNRLLSSDEASMSAWFLNNYIRKCLKICPGSVSRLFSDVSTSTKMQNAVSAVVDWRANSKLYELWPILRSQQYHITETVSNYSLTLRSCVYWMTGLPKLDGRLPLYFAAVALLHVARKTTITGFSDKLMDILATVVGQHIGTGRSSKRTSCVLWLSKAANFMKVVANESRTNLQRIQIELSKAYLYRALRCKDSDSDSIYCLANVYLAVLYYTTGQYQMTIDHCTLVMRSQDHSQCSPHVVQGELLPKTDDIIDNVLGLAVFYQHVRTAVLNQQQQTHVTVFTTELFAHYLHIKCMSFTKCQQLSDAAQSHSSGYGISDNAIYNIEKQQIADILLWKFVNAFLVHKILHMRQFGSCQYPISLVECLQQSAVDHMTTYRQLQARDCGSVITIVPTDFEALYAYKRDDYQQCLQLSTQNVHTLLYAVRMPDVSTLPQFIQLLDDDIVSLTALTLIVDSDCRVYYDVYASITQLTLSLYLMTQCQLKLRHSVTSLAQTLDYIEVAHRRHSSSSILNHLTLKLIERKVVEYLNTFV